MNTENMPEEEEIDRIFRQAADSYEPEFAPEAWQDLAQKLDAAAAPQPTANRRRRKGLGLLFLLLLSVTGIFIFRRQVVRQKNVAVETTETSGRSSAQQEQATEKEKAKSAINEAKKQPVIKPVIPKNTPAEKSSAMANAGPAPTTSKMTASAETFGKTQATSIQKIRAKGKGPRLKPPVQADPGATTGGEKPAPLAADSRFTRYSLEAKQPAVALPDTIAAAAVTNPPAGSPAAQAPGDSITPVVAADTTAPAAEKLVAVDSLLKYAHKKRISRLSVSLVLAPDISAVNFRRSEKVSTNIGALLNYQLSPRWVVSAGAVRARKVYDAKPSDYRSKYWYGKHLPDAIYAVCQVLDIPVNLRYNFIARPKQAMYVQAGVSSYLMREEDYRYDFTSAYPTYSRNWMVKRRNKHLFGVANVAVGYNRQLWPGTSVGVEPFVKVPLTGIGAGKVNLTSVGAWFSVSYQLQ